MPMKYYSALRPAPEGVGLKGRDRESGICFLFQTPVAMRVNKKELQTR